MGCEIYIYISVGVWLIGLIVLFVALLTKFTFGSWTADNPNPYANETFAMPPGVLRGILTLTLLFLIVILEAVRLSQCVAIPDNFSDLYTAFQMMLAFYFGSKVMNQITDNDRRKSENMANAISGQGQAG